MTCNEALDVVALAVASNEPRHFQIALVGYRVDGRPYPADGLAVNAWTTPEFVRTAEGFECDGFFPPHLLDADTVRVRGVSRSASGVAMVQVRLAVSEGDIWAIAEFVDGRQRNLFVDPTVMVRRKFAFADEATRWHSMHDAARQAAN